MQRWRYLRMAEEETTFLPPVGWDVQSSCYPWPPSPSKTKWNSAARLLLPTPQSSWLLPAMADTPHGKILTRPFPGGFSVEDGERIVAVKSRLQEGHGYGGCQRCQTFSKGRTLPGKRRSFRSVTIYMLLLVWLAQTHVPGVSIPPRSIPQTSLGSARLHALCLTPIFLQALVIVHHGLTT